jgi:hypothetical protein
MKKMLSGSILCALSIVLAGLLYLRAYQEFYWLNPSIFIFLTLVAVGSALSGGLFLGAALREKTKDAAYFRPLFWTGAVIGVAAILIDLSAIGLAAGVSMTGYWGTAPYEYSGDYSIMGYQMMVFKLALVMSLVGSFLWFLGCGKTTGA